MSANINFAAGSAATATSGTRPSSSNTGGNAAGATATAASSSALPSDAKSKSHMILPYEVLFNLVGRRVTVVLTKKGHELEGTLQSVDSDKGDMLLSEVTHYHWLSASASSADNAGGEERAAEASRRAEEGFQACFGGGVRKEVSRCSQAMVNSAFVALVTPTLFIPA